MATNYPTSLDTPLNPIGTDELANATPGLQHHVQHDNENDAIVALETKVGINGSVATSSLDYLARNPILDKASGHGIKVDPAAPTFPWRDIIGQIIPSGAGSGVAPTFAQYQGNIYAWSFTTTGTKEVFVIFHIPHDYLPGSDIFIHTHWSQILVDTGGAGSTPGNIKWYFDVSYAKGHERGAFSAPITTSVVQTASAIQYEHMLAEVQLSAGSPSGSQLDTALLEPDGVMMVRVYRDATDVADTLNKAPFLHFCDIHYQTTNIGTKERTPDFYV